MLYEPARGHDNDPARGCWGADGLPFGVQLIAPVSPTGRCSIWPPAGRVAPREPSDRLTGPTGGCGRAPVGPARERRTRRPALSLGRLRLADGSDVTGFLAAGQPDAADEITRHGGWRGYLAALTD